MQTDAKGQQIKFFYNDPAGRLTRREGWTATGQCVSTNTWQYDSSGGDGAYTVYPGQLFAVTDDEGWQKFSYDVRGRTLKTVRYLARNGQTYTNQFAYDDADRLNRIAYPAGGPTVTNILDTGGNLSQVKQVGGSNTVYYAAKGFDALGRLKGITFGNGVQSSNFFYTVSLRLQKITSAKTTNIQSLVYGYDAVGNITNIADGVYSGPASASMGKIQYDDLNRLVSLTNTSGTFNYAYDSVGNILTNGEGGSGNYVYGAIRPHCVRSANGLSYTYDPNGNVANRGGMRLLYDVNNRLAYVITRTNLVQFGYDANGARLWKQNGTNLQVWIGQNYEEKNGQILFHIYAGDRLICTFDRTGTNVFQYYQPNHLTSTSIQTDQTGSRIQHYEYSAFGRTRFTESATAFPVSRRYTSQVLDEDTGLYYYNFRYYDPVLARFIQPDDIIPDLSNPQSYNRYSYVLNNPLRYTDPNGHEEDDFDVPLTLGAGHAALRRAAGDASARLYQGSERDLAMAAAVGRTVAEMHPAVGFVNSGYQAVTGEDAIDQHRLSAGERVWSGVGAGLEVGGKAVKLAACVGAVVVTAKTLEGAGDIRRAQKVAEATARGRAAEARVLKEMGLPKNKLKVSTVEGNAIPDALTQTLSVEVKDTVVVNRTKQIRIQTEAARTSQRESVLVTGSKTHISEPARQSFDKIKQRPDLGPQ